MKTLAKIFICAFISYPGYLFSQQAPTIIWQKCLGGSIYNKFLTNSEAFGNTGAGSIVQLSNGGFVIAGWNISNDGDAAGLNHGGEDIWVMNMTPSGIMEWQKCFGGSGNDEARCIIQTSDGGYAIAGWTTSFDGDVSGHVLQTDYYGDTLQCAWVVKLDYYGNIQWQKCLGGIRGTSQANSIIQTSDGGYTVGGWTSSHDEGLFNNAKTEARIIAPNTNAYIAKLDASGNIEWQRCYGGKGSEAIGTIFQTADGEYVFAGDAASDSGEVIGNHGINGTSDIWLVKINSGGDSIRWQKCLGGSGNDLENATVRTKDRGYAICGSTTTNNDGNVSGHHPDNYGCCFNTDAWVIKTDSLGNIEWQKCLGGSKNDAAYSIIQTSDEGYLITGATNSTDGDVSGKHGTNDSNDVWVVKLSSVGAIQWQKCLGGTNDDDGLTAIQEHDGKYIIAGMTQSNNDDVSGNKGKQNMWVVKLDANANSVESADGTNFKWLYPNPASDIIKVFIYNAPLNQIHIYDMLGFEYFPDYKLEGGQVIIDVHSLPTGPYVLRISYLKQWENLTEQVQKFLHYR